MKIEVTEFSRNKLTMGETEYRLGVRLPDGKRLEQRVAVARYDEITPALDEDIRHRLKKDMRRAIADRVEFVL